MRYVRPMAAATAAGLVLLAVMNRPDAAAALQPGAIKPATWEYRVVRVDNVVPAVASQEKVLNDLGEEGWELVTDNNNRWILKRQKPPRAN